MTNLYSVSYNTNNSTGGVTPPTQTATSDSTTYTFRAPTAEEYGLAKTNYGFVGWAENPNANVPEYFPAGTIELTPSNPSKNLYAVWVNSDTIITESDSWDNLYYMQQMSSIACNSIDTPKASDKYVPQKQLFDVRDFKTYWVAKLADGNCWMTQNLDFNLQQGKALTSNASDVIGDWTPGEEESTITTALNTKKWPNTNNIIRSWDPALGGNPSYCNDGIVGTSGNCKVTDNPTSSSNDGHDAQGNYYTWCAATAGCKTINDTDPEANEEAASSICPKGWRLPSNSSKQGPAFTGLQTTYSIGNVGSKFLDSPLLFVYGGFVDNGSFLSPNAGEGRYWTSTSYDSTRAYDFLFNATSVNTSNRNMNRQRGFSVRCVAR